MPQRPGVFLQIFSSFIYISHLKNRLKVFQASEYAGNALMTVFIFKVTCHRFSYKCCAAMVWAFFPLLSVKSASTTSPQHNFRNHCHFGVFLVVVLVFFLGGGRIVFLPHPLSIILLLNLRFWNSIVYEEVCTYLWPSSYCVLNV